MKPTPPKLSKRLYQIESMVTGDYTHVWDCCCDHGLLGASLLARQAADHIHFVDVLPELISELENKLRRFYPTAMGNWHTHCLDTAALPLAQFSGKHLIIIAGVGGDLMMRFIQSISLQHPHVVLDFLLCPVHQEYNLRKQLIKLGFRLKEEVLVQDNRRFYEVLLVSANPDPAEVREDVSPVGHDIWQAKSAMQAKIARGYLAKTLTHYENVQAGGREDVSQVLAAYRAVRVNAGD
ncbi:MAG TPA: tRNA (adenine(22)-N(1))-methyltransferase TrmK [Halomonas sp.]|nr:tRNA (adenine(22)-N(1))-methyltransferase TrmK [Halomonas sp.]